MKYVVRAASPKDGKERNLLVDAATPAEAEAKVNTRGLLVASVRPAGNPPVPVSPAVPASLSVHGPGPASSPPAFKSKSPSPVHALVGPWLGKHRRRLLWSAAALVVVIPLLGWLINLGDTSLVGHTGGALSLEDGSSPMPAWPKAGLARRSASGDHSDLTAPEQVPAPIVMANGTDPLVISKKVPVGGGLLLTVSFVVVDPSEPRAAALEGVAGIVLLENLDTLGEYRLDRSTQMALRRGDRRFAFDDPEPKTVNDHLTAVDYTSFEPSLLLRFLGGDSGGGGGGDGAQDIEVEVDGRSYPLAHRWSAHLVRVAEEAQRQRQARQDRARRSGGGGRGGGGSGDVEAALAFMRLTGVNHEEIWPTLERSLDRRTDLTDARRAELKARYLAHEPEILDDIAKAYLRHFSGAELRDMIALQLDGARAPLTTDRMQYILDRMKVETPKLNDAVDQVVRGWVKRLSE